jgi:hypothetical protein
VGGVFGPAHSDPSSRLEGGIDRVADQVDQELVQLIAVGLNGQLRPGLEHGLQPGF